jgi:hypothetical protein
LRRENFTVGMHQNGHAKQVLQIEQKNACVMNRKLALLGKNDLEQKSRHGKFSPCRL